MSDNYAQEIRKTVKKYKNKTDRQRVVKQIMHILFKIRKVKVQAGEWINIKQTKLRTS